MILYNFCSTILRYKEPYVVLPYILLNIGEQTAVNVKKGYISAIGKKIIQEYIEPAGTTPDLPNNERDPNPLCHMDNINITGFDGYQFPFVEVRLRVTYEIDGEKRTKGADINVYPVEFEGKKFFRIRNIFI